MLEGRFGGNTGRPYVDGRLFVLGRQELSSDISFLVDTGADGSMLMPADALRMEIEYDRLRHRTEAVGIGGTARTFVEEAVVVFSEPGRFLYAYYIQLRIAEPSHEIMDLPSLLGRDVLDRWRMTYDPQRGRLAFSVKSWDQRIAIPRR